MATALAVPMPRKIKRNDVVTKLDADVARIAKIVAAYEEITQAELISEILRPVLVKRLEHHQREAARRKSD